MPIGPQQSDVYVSRPLTNLSLAYALQTDEFIAGQVFGNVPSEVQGGTFRKYKRAEWNRTDVEKRAPHTESKGVGYTLEDDNYFAHIYAIHVDIDDPVRANVQDPINLDRDATNLATRQLLLKRDQIWFDTFFKTGVWGTDLVGTTDFVKWSASNSTPIVDIKTRILAMQKATGMRPNTLVLGSLTWLKLSDHANLLDRIKAVQGPQIPTTQLLAQLLDIDRVLVGYGIQNTAIEGAAESNSFLMDDDSALLCYTNPSPGQLTISAGYTFTWTGYMGATQLGTRIKRFRMEPIASDRVEGEMAFDMKVVAPDLGVFFSDAVD